MIRDGKMPEDANPATNCAMRSNSGTACNSDAASNGRMVANLDVMGNMNEVVDLHTRANSRIVQGASVDSGVRTNFHLCANYDTTELFDFLPAQFPRWCKPETIRPNYATTVKDAAFSDGHVVEKRHSRVQKAAGTHLAPPAHAAMRPDHCTSAHHCPGANHCTHADVSIRRDRG